MRRRSNEESKRRDQHLIDLDREELRGIYDFHKLPVPDYIVPEIVPNRVPKIFPKIILKNAPKNF